MTINIVKIKVSINLQFKSQDIITRLLNSCPKLSTIVDSLQRKLNLAYLKSLLSGESSCNHVSEEGHSGLTQPGAVQKNPEWKLGMR